MNFAFDREQAGSELTLAASEVLETMFFSSIDREWSADEGVSRCSEGRRRLRALVTFTGHYDGRIQLSLERDVAQGLAASFLGESDERSDDLEGESTMAEMANMICGNLLSRLEKSSIFHLSSPRVAEEDPCDLPALSFGTESAIEKFFVVESGLMRLGFAVAQNPVPETRAAGK